MSFPLLPPSVDAAIGGTVAHEELRGDLTQARAAGELALTQAVAAGDGAALAAARLGRGVVHLLQGEPRAALACFEAVGAEGAPALLAHLCGVLATFQRYLVFPHGGASSTLTIEARWSSHDYARETDARWQTLRAAVADSAVLLHADFVYDVLHKLPSARFMLDRSQQIAPPADLLRRARMLIPPLLAFGDRARREGGGPRLVAFVERSAADLLWRARYKADAGDHLRNALALAEEEGDGPGVAACWTMLGDWLSAPVSSPLVHNHLMLEGDWTGALSWVDERLVLDRSQMDLVGAARAFASARELYEQVGARRGIGALALRQGYLEALDGRWDRAGELAAEAEGMFQAAGDTLLGWLARAHRALAAIGAPDREQDLALADAIGAWGREEGSFSFATGLGLLFTREGRRWLVGAGDYARALACHGLARALFRSLGAPDNAAQATADAGDVHQAIGEHRAARVAYDEAREAYQGLITAAPGLATAAWQKAVLAADATCATAAAIEDADAIEESTGHLGRVLAAPPPPAGPDLFGEELKDSMSRLVALRRDHSAVVVPLLRAAAARELGDPAADGLFDAALAAARAASEGQRDFLEAIVLRALGRKAEAAAAFLRFRDKGGAMAGLTGDLATRVAARFGEAGQAVAARQSEQTPLYAASFHASVGAFADARRELDALTQVRGAAFWAGDERPWEGMALDACVREGMGDLDGALSRYDEAVRLLDERWTLLTRDEMKRAMAGQRSARDVYLGAARAALEASRRTPERAPELLASSFAYAERDRARALIDLMTARASPPGCAELLRALRSASAKVELGRTLLTEERRRSGSDAARVAQLTRLVADEEEHIRSIERDLRAAGGNFLDGRRLTLEETSAALAEGTAILQYSLLGDDLLAWAIDRSGVVDARVIQVDARTLTRQVRAYHRACSGRAPTDDLGAALAATLLEPLAGAIERSAHLVIISYGVAHLVPFHALPYAGAPLCVRRTVSYLPSASVLQFRRAGAAQHRSILAVGNPANMVFQLEEGGPEVPLRPLPAAEAEAALVAGLFPEGMALLGGQATEDAVRTALPRYPLIHLATHGVLSEDAPLLSSLRLAGRGRLTVSDLMGLHLDVDLAVLSACQTGRGAAAGGDEVVGLTRGLLAAGARAAVVSLWPVDDAATCLLMRAFYRSMNQGRPPARALQDAQLHLLGMRAGEASAELVEALRALPDEALSEAARRSVAEAGARDLSRIGAPAGAAPGYDHPYYWAPFTLVGVGL